MIIFLLFKKRCDGVAVDFGLVLIGSVIFFDSGCVVFFYFGIQSYNEVKKQSMKNKMRDKIREDNPLLLSVFML